MAKLSKEDFVKKMMANEDFKRAEKRRNLIWEKKRETYDYIDFSLANKSKEIKRKR